MAKAPSGRLNPFSSAPEILHRLVLPLAFIIGAFLFGTVGFMVIGGGQWNIFECAYMTSLTLTSVGYGEVLEVMGPSARTLAMVLMWVGLGVTLYALSTVTAFVVERDLTRILRERRMEKRIAKMKDHYILCGAGQTGLHVVSELHTTRRPLVVLENDPERIEWLQTRFEKIPLLRGDATEEEALRKAGVERAQGIIAALPNESQNMLITVQVRYINPQVRICARCDATNLVEKFFRAGANYVINPSLIGGMRMASQMIRPQVVNFLDRMLRGQDPSIRVEEVTIGQGSSLAGQKMKEANLHSRTGLTPVALKKQESEEFIYNPKPEEELQIGTVIIVIGPTEQINALRRLAAD